MRRLFWTNPYQASNTTVVTSASGRDVTLRESVFYAFSGGQESDSGTIGRIDVAKATVTGDTIVYTLADDHRLRRGDEVEVQIDWNRRYRLMRLHFAAEIVLVLTMERFPGIERIGAHISEAKARLDFLLDAPITAELPAIEARANALVAEDQVIISAYSDEQLQRRYWEIEGFGQMECAGTHIRSTGEVGTIRLARQNPGRGKERVEIRVDMEGRRGGDS